MIRRRAHAGVSRSASASRRRSPPSLPEWLYRAAIVAVVAAAPVPALARSEASPPSSSALGSGLQVFVTPYFWLAGVDAAIKTPIPQAPTVNVDVGAIQMLSNLDGVPFMGAFEVRQGRVGMLGDALHVPVGANVTTRNVFFNGGTASLAANTGTAMFLYRPYDTPDQSADLGIGLRAWGFSSDLTLNPGRVPGMRVSRSGGWVDPLIGGRYHINLDRGFELTAYGDVGGFGLGAHVDWQVMGTVDYHPAPWVTLHLGYRSLNFNYTGVTDVGFNVHMKGPILAATFRF
jgi:hypothetical protein